jgi:hypothetical protein
VTKRAFSILSWCAVLTLLVAIVASGLQPSGAAPIPKDAWNVEFVGSYDAPGSAYDVAVAGNFAYVAAVSAGLRIIDVSDPAAPFEAGFYDIPAYAEGVAVAGGYTYVADTDGGLFILRLTGEDAPMFVQFIHLAPIQPQLGLELVVGLARIVDENLQAVAGATVDLEWTLPVPYTVPQSKPANANGLAVSFMWGFWPGTYEL